MPSLSDQEARDDVSTIPQSDLDVIGGVDTHKDTHTAAAIDPAGRLLGTAQYPATPAGYAALLAWLNHFGRVVLIGVEGTGVYGAGLSRYLRTHGVDLVEVDRPDRKARRSQGKSDPVDAEAAARAALAKRATGIPKQRDGRVEALRNLRVARRSAVLQRADVQRQLQCLVITAPEPLRSELRPLAVAGLIHHVVEASVDERHIDDPAVAAMLALQILANRHRQLTAELKMLDRLIAPLVERISPQLCAVNGIGPDIAGQLLVTAGDNPDRLHTESAFAMLCGVAPLQASSSRTSRHRLNRGGDRQANAALYRVVLCRLRWDERTRAYAERRKKEGMSSKEIIRCLKRYVAREVYAILNPQKGS